MICVNSMSKAGIAALAIVLVSSICATANAALVNVATWTQNQNTGGGPLTLNGTLAGSSVTLATSALPPNAGAAGFEDWSTDVGTNSYVSSQAQTSGNTWIGIAEGSSTTEVVTLGSAVTNPVILLDYDDPTASYNWGNLNTALLSGNNALLTSNVLTFPGATNNFGDGAAIRINGTFTTFSFVASDSGGRTDTQRFSLATPVPEPASITGFSLATLLLRCRQMRKRGHHSIRGNG